MSNPFIRIHKICNGKIPDSYDNDRFLHNLDWELKAAELFYKPSPKPCEQNILQYHDNKHKHVDAFELLTNRWKNIPAPQVVDVADYKRTLGGDDRFFINRDAEVKMNRWKNIPAPQVVDAADYKRTLGGDDRFFINRETQLKMNYLKNTPAHLLWMKAYSDYREK